MALLTFKAEKKPTSGTCSSESELNVIFIKYLRSNNILQSGQGQYCPVGSRSKIKVTITLLASKNRKSYLGNVLPWNYELKVKLHIVE